MTLKSNNPTSYRHSIGEDPRARELWRSQNQKVEVEAPRGLIGRVSDFIFGSKTSAHQAFAPKAHYVGNEATTVQEAYKNMENGVKDTYSASDAELFNIISNVQTRFKDQL